MKKNTALENVERKKGQLDRGAVPVFQPDRSGFNKRFSANLHFFQAVFQHNNQ